ncbi:unnamed protein product [Calypogeia fissa]
MADLESESRGEDFDENWYANAEEEEDEQDEMLYLHDLDDEVLADLDLDALISVSQRRVTLSNVAASQSRASNVNSVDESESLRSAIVQTRGLAIVPSQSHVTTDSSNVLVSGFQGGDCVMAKGSSHAMVVRGDRSVQAAKGKGLRSQPDPTLVLAARGEARQRSESNDRWAKKRVDEMRQALGWDVSIPPGDLSLEELDYLFSELFTRVCKVDGSRLPSASLMNLCNAFNRMIRMTSEVRAANGVSTGFFVPRSFNIKEHPSFARTRLVLEAAVKLSAHEGVNKPRPQATTISEAMEKAVLQDIDHQITSPHACQKRLAWYLLLRMGIRGGGELYNLMRQDINIQSTLEGREYVRYFYSRN